MLYEGFVLDLTDSKIYGEFDIWGFNSALLKASMKKSPPPKINALAQLAENTECDITELVRRNLNIELGTQKKIQSK